MDDSGLRKEETRYVTDATKTIKCTITNPIGEIVETYVGASQCNLPAIIGKSVYGDIIQGATIQTASGADLDEMNERLTWKTCTVTANSTYGYFYNNTSGAKYRYDDNILEVSVFVSFCKEGKDGRVAVLLHKDSIIYLLSVL